MNSLWDASETMLQGVPRSMDQIDSSQINSTLGGQQMGFGGPQGFVP